MQGVRGPVRPASARSGYIYQGKHDYVTYDPLGPGRLLTDPLGTKSLVAMSESCTCSVFSRGIYGIIQNSSKHRADSQCMSCDFPRVYTGFALTGPVDCPRPCGSSWTFSVYLFGDQHEAITGSVEPTSMGAFWTMHDSLRSSEAHL